MRILFPYPFFRKPFPLLWGRESRLVNPIDYEVFRTRLHQFIVHGVPVSFPAKSVGSARGVLTAWAAPVMADAWLVPSNDPPVWADENPNGVQGVGIEPLHKNAVKAAQNDPRLYDLLALVDAVRIGRARERAYADLALRRKLVEEASNA